ncbi:MAG: hypothetical protein JSS49_06900 [Planctomycetes bacterium]|nr:hypothetical protein [Planctomycetota bacterium]
MRHLVFASVLAVSLTLPALCFALLYTVEGNAPQSAENYKRWPGFVDVVNQPSRQQLVWCNGAESFYYSGDTQALNAILRDFAKVECPTHTVIFRPGPLQNKYDWHVAIVEGIARHHVVANRLQLVNDLDPVLTVYISDKLKLDSVVVPQEIQIRQLSDLRSRYLDAQKDETAKPGADRLLEALDEDPILKQLGAKDYEARIQQIASFVELRRPKK